MKIMCFDNSNVDCSVGNQTIIYNVNHIVRITKSLEYGKPCIKILTTAGSLDTIGYEHEEDCLKSIAALKREMELA